MPKPTDRNLSSHVYRDLTRTPTRPVVLPPRDPFHAMLNFVWFTGKVVILLLAAWKAGEIIGAIINVFSSR